MAEKEDPRQKIARETLTPFEKSVPEFGETASLLDLLNSFPEMYVESTGDALGTYESFKNQLTIAPRAFYNNYAQETALHELTHALNENMSRSYFNMDPKYRRDFKSATDEELKFTDAYNKLRPAQSALIDNKDAKEDPYRYDSDELAAYAVARHGFPKIRDPYPVRDHLNATLAQEAAVLRDLYLRALKSRK